MIDDFPLILTAKHISEIMMVSKRTAYLLMESPGFPLIKVGRNKRVIGEEFVKWLEQQKNTNK
ncbi:helix-turn-helix domain-containing protein [Neobacillus vireti]|uniref:helix-turn-helix domain-containing protein n=1 Tax=Neobacillus vireti TaxID=220686 RepID=UPI002FFDF0C4